MTELLRRFWCYELIGPRERSKLREALDGLDRVGATLLPLSRLYPTCDRHVTDM